MKIKFAQPVAFFLSFLLACAPSDFLKAESEDQEDSDQADFIQAYPQDGHFQEDQGFFPPESQMSSGDSNALMMDVPMPTDPGKPVDVKNQRVTLELKGVDVLDVLKILSARSGVNIVAGKNVRGQVTIYLKEVLIYEALDTIVNALELAYEEDQGIIKVMTSKEYETLHGRPYRDRRITKTFRAKHAQSQALQQLAQQLKSSVGKIIYDERTNTMVVTDVPETVAEVENAIKMIDEPLLTRVFKLEYASVADIQEQIQDYVTPESGLIRVDERSNKIAVTDRSESLDRIEQVIREFDIRPPQVLIQAQIIEVALYDAFRYGVDWTYVRNNLAKHFKDLNISPEYSADLAVPGSSFGGGTMSTMNIGAIGAGWENIVLSILQNIGKTNTLSAPRLTVLNNEEAKIGEATRQPYLTQTVIVGDSATTSATADDIKFVDVGVTMTVVPTISDNNTIVLKIKPEVSSATGTYDIKTASGSVTEPFVRSTIPIVSTQTLETTVIVKSGETLIVGGLIKDANSKIRKKLPVLGDIPFLGAAFRSDSIDFRKSELVIFLTPYIVAGDVSTKERQKFLNSDGQMIDFDKVGGFDYALGQKYSQWPFQEENKPYWQIKEPKSPRIFSPKDVFTRAEPYSDRNDMFEGYAEGRKPFSTDEFLKEYEKEAGNRVIMSIADIDALQQLDGTVDFSITVRRDGVLEDVSFVNSGPIRDKKLKQQVLRAISQKAGPFPAFPQNLDAERENIRLRFELTPQV